MKMQEMQKHDKVFLQKFDQYYEAKQFIKQLWLWNQIYDLLLQNVVLFNKQTVLSSLFFEKEALDIQLQKVFKISNVSLSVCLIVIPYLQFLVLTLF